MDITLTNCRCAPKWESLQTIIREATNSPGGKLTRISRKDNGVDYRGLGEYQLEFYRPENQTSLPINLTVQ